ncbi:MAG: hypothetical protein ACJ789_01515 [Thermomicrobiales bacterium]
MINRRRAIVTAGRFSLGLVLGKAALPSGVLAVDDGTNPDYYTPVPDVTETVGGLLPQYRLLSYYGFPDNALMGILGEYDKDTLLAKLQDQAAAYAAIDPDRPLKLAFEMMATVALANSGPDGNYIRYTDPDVMQDYVDFTAANDMVLIFDVQFGRASVQDQVDYVRPWLAYEHVHLALDPEFHVTDSEVPGQELGSITAADVTYAQEQLVQIAQNNNIPPKFLIVHQFNYYSLPDKENIGIVPGMQLVMTADGFGPPADKLATYDVIVTKREIEYNGFKLFYQQDDPLMAPADVLNLNPVPDLIIYQ